MALHRAMVGLAISASILVVMVVTAVRFPTVGKLVFFGPLAGVFVFLAGHALRTGVIRTRSGRYERSANPFEFWFFTAFVGLVGLGICGYAVGSVFYR